MPVTKLEKVNVKGASVSRNNDSDSSCHRRDAGLWMPNHRLAAVASGIADLPSKSKPKESGGSGKYDIEWFRDEINDIKVVTRSEVRNTFFRGCQPEGGESSFGLVHFPENLHEPGLILHAGNVAISRINYETRDGLEHLVHPHNILEDQAETLDAPIEEMSQEELVEFSQKLLSTIPRIAPELEEELTKIGKLNTKNVASTKKWIKRVFHMLQSKETCSVAMSPEEVKKRIGDGKRFSLKNRDCILLYSAIIGTVLSDEEIEEILLEEYYLDNTCHEILNKAGLRLDDSNQFMAMVIIDVLRREVKRKKKRKKKKGNNNKSA
jgi:hypothetical protein